MRVVEIRNICREEGSIYYLRKFKGEAVIELPGGDFESPVEFSIEADPLGAKKIDIVISETINYPVVPIKNALRAYISAADAKGKLPL